jgi:hypothetical protein
LALATLMSALAWADANRRGLWLGLMSGTIGAGTYLGLAWLRRREATLPRAWLVVDDEEIPFGISVLANASRSRVLLAFTTLYLSDARGTPISVERERLVIGERSIDLGAPVDWRVFTFQEGDRYQATSIRQGSHEVVLVCRAGADVASWSSGGADAPPRESRVAIDGLFMTPIRAMLEQAPRISRPGPPPERRRGRNVVT